MSQITEQAGSYSITSLHFLCRRTGTLPFLRGSNTGAPKTPWTRPRGFQHPTALRPSAGNRQF